MAGPPRRIKGGWAGGVRAKLVWSRLPLPGTLKPDAISIPASVSTAMPFLGLAPEDRDGPVRRRAHGAIGVCQRWHDLACGSPEPTPGMNKLPGLSARALLRI